MSWSAEDVYLGGQYAVKELRIDAGGEIPWHVHDRKEETYYVVSGSVRVHYRLASLVDARAMLQLEAGGYMTMSAGHPHKLEAVGGPVVILEPQGPDVDDIRWL